MRSCRLLLLSCRSPFLDDSRIYPPLANLYLKSALAQACPHVDVTLGDDDYDLQNLETLGPFDAIGISIMTPQRAEALCLARAIKAIWPTKILIAGGPHVKHYRESLERDAVFDYLVPFDGERALASVFNGTAAGSVLADTLPRDVLLSQPRPDRTSEQAARLLGNYHYRLGERTATTLMTARGCPEQCTFCEDAGTQTRSTALRTIAAELDDIVALGYGGVYIFDDLFALSVHRIRPICLELQKRDLRYRCNAQARYFTKWGTEMARLLADTGCHEIAFGAESGSQVILDNVKKRCTVEQNYQTVAYAKQFGLKIKAFMLLGLPGESWETLAQTEAFIRDSGIDDFQCAIYMPYKGTEIRRQIDAGQVIDIDVIPAGEDGEISGAYGIVGGATACEVRTRHLSQVDLLSFRDYLVKTYRPASHKQKWTFDALFDSHLAGAVTFTSAPARD